MPSTNPDKMRPKCLGSQIDNPDRNARKYYGMCINPDKYLAISCGKIPRLEALKETQDDRGAGTRLKVQVACWREQLGLFFRLACFWGCNGVISNGISLPGLPAKND